MPPPSPADIVEARRALAAACPAMARLDAAVAPFAWRTRPGGFEGLTWMIVGQQVSTQAATAIWKTLNAGLGGAVTPAGVLAHTHEQLRGFGLSLPKARYVHAIAEAEASGVVNLDDLDHLSDDDAVAALTAIKGVGRWTAEVFLMFCEGRADLFPAADIALQEAIRHADGLDARPTVKDLYVRAEAWAPYRSVAAHLGWAYYGAAVRDRTIPPLSSAESIAA